MISGTSRCSCVIAMCWGMYKFKKLKRCGYCVVYLLIQLISRLNYFWTDLVSCDTSCVMFVFNKFLVQLLTKQSVIK